jgi:hypothetical protein
VITAFLGTRQMKMFAERIEQRDSRIDSQSMLTAIDVQLQIQRLISFNPTHAASQVRCRSADAACRPEERGAG